ncbi:unnamed protein product [Durusdinium trenchii]|uniref:RING-type domain-containing protein n=1 Tax=Durusdinium trenchii TaxID=1381693 RepID=A0ABP0QM39_9DINO
MEDIDLVLQQWRSLEPDGAVFRAECLDAAIAMVGNLIAESGAQRCSQRKALQLLRVDEQIQVPVLVQMLQVDVDFLFNEPKPGKADGLSSAVVYFPCFWQAMHELQKRLGGDPMDKGTEPFAEEASSFRDAILDLAASQRLTTASFADLVIAFKGTSTDQRAWDSLLESLRFLMRETKATKHIDCSRTLQQLILAQEPMPMAFVASILLPWIFELCEDYRRGERAGLLRAVRDVLGCSLRDACELLAKGKWDLETALRQHDLQNQCNTLDALEACRPDCVGWNSNAAKIRRAERECPICACDFRIGAEPTVTSCCFKSICSHCVAVLVARVEDGLLHCPFCRQVEQVPIARHCHLPEVQTSEDPLEQLAEAAQRWASSAISVGAAVLTEVRSLFPDGPSWTATYSSSRPNSLDIRLNVVLPLSP